MTVDHAARGIAGFGGELVWVGDASYDEARAVWNAMHDRRPQVVARCTSVEDVVAAIAYGRERGLPIAVRCGGHSMPGHSVCDGGIVIDLRGLGEVTVDPQAKRARVGGGALLGEVDRATQAHGLVVPAGVVSHTGVGGLTLGGGVGRLMRRFGLTIDSLLSAEVVTADGEVVRASPDQHPDLFWGLRGGGGNFGIVTEFEFALHELRELAVLAMFHRLEDVRPVLSRGRAAMGDPDAPDELLWTSFLRKAPPLPWVPPELDGTPGIMSLVEWSGAAPDGHIRLAGIMAELAPLAASLDTVPFLDIQTMTDEIFAHGKRTYIKAGFAGELSDDLIDALAKQGSEVSSPLSQIEVLAMRGAIARVASDATAFPHRDAAWLINIPAMWDTPDEREAAAEIGWARRSFRAFERLLLKGRYVNFMDGDEEPESTSAYGSTEGRLHEIKRVWDPSNVFRLNQNIRP